MWILFMILVPVSCQVNRVKRSFEETDPPLNICCGNNITVPEIPKECVPPVDLDGATDPLEIGWITYKTWVCKVECYMKVLQVWNGTVQKSNLASTLEKWYPSNPELVKKAMLQFDDSLLLAEKVQKDYDMFAHDLHCKMLPVTLFLWVQEQIEMKCPKPQSLQTPECFRLRKTFGNMH